MYFRGAALCTCTHVWEVPAARLLTARGFLLLFLDRKHPQSVTSLHWGGWGGVDAAGMPAEHPGAGMERPALLAAALMQPLLSGQLLGFFLFPP